MFEKKQAKIDESTDVQDTLAVDTVRGSSTADYGLFSLADVAIDGDELVITVPLRYGVTTVRAHKAILAAWATDNVAGKLLEEAKKYNP